MTFDRTPRFKEAPALKPARRRIPQVSKKMARQRRQERETKRRVLARDGGCVLGLEREVVLVDAKGERCRVPPCSGPLDKHELIKRSAWRAGAVVEENCVILCRTHNGWTEDHPSCATQLGLVIRSRR